MALIFAKELFLDVNRYTEYLPEISGTEHLDKRNKVIRIFKYNDIGVIFGDKVIHHVRYLTIRQMRRSIHKFIKELTYIARVSELLYPLGAFSVF